MYPFAWPQQVLVAVRVGSDRIVTYRQRTGHVAQVAVGAAEIVPVWR